MNGYTLQERVMKQLGDDASVSSATNSKLKFCSKELATVTTVDEFDEITKKYSLLDDKLKRSGLLREDFKKIINDMRSEL